MKSKRQILCRMLIFEFHANQGSTSLTFQVPCWLKYNHFLCNLKPAWTQSQPQRSVLFESRLLSIATFLPDINHHSEGLLHSATWTTPLVQPLYPHHSLKLAETLPSLKSDTIMPVLTALLAISASQCRQWRLENELKWPCNHDVMKCPSCSLRESQSKKPALDVMIWMYMILPRN